MYNIYTRVKTGKTGFFFFNRINNCEVYTRVVNIFFLFAIDFRKQQIIQ